MISLEKRAMAAQATLDKFKDRPFKFGKYDCGQMVRFHLRAVGRPIKSAKAGSYHSLLGAKRALRRLGHESLLDLMDAHFPRIPPAAAVVGDVIAMPGMEGPGALAVRLTNGRVLCYAEGAEGAIVGQPQEFVAAWRVG